MKKNKLLLLLALLLTAATGAWAQDYYAPSTDEVIILNEVYNASNSGYSSHSAIAWGGTASTSSKKAGDPNNGGQPTSSTVNCYSVKGNGKGKNITLSITGVSKVIVYHEKHSSRYIELRDGSKEGNIIGSGQTDTYYTEVALTATNQYSIFLHGTSNGSDDQDFNVYAIKLIAAAASDPATAGYTVSLKDGVKDADKWTVSPNPAEEGQTVTLQYNGRLKVKGVTATSDAAPAKEPATVTTAPTGAAIVGVGKSTELVSGGVADGGTLMYAVTTTNTKPASTDGFSGTVPTAEDITASGTVYVWYYVKADDTHSDSEIAATAIEVPVADIVWDATNITDLDVFGNYEPYTKEGVKLSGNAEDVYARWNNNSNPERVGISFETMESGGFTFTAPTGKNFTKIVMTLNGPAGWDFANLGTGWSYSEEEICKVTWKGDSAASTVDLLKDAGNFMGGEKVKSIAFYLSE